MHGLEVPDALAGRGAQRDERVGVEVGAGAIDADEVRADGADRQEDEAARRIGGDRRPHVRGARRRVAGLERLERPDAARPLRASNARTSPGGLSARIRSAIDEPTTTTSPTTIGGEVTLYSHGSVSGAIPSREIDDPVRAEVRARTTRSPRRARSAARRASRAGRAQRTRAQSGSPLQYATPRLMIMFAKMRSVSISGSKVQSSRPVSGSSAITRFIGVVKISRPSTTIGVVSMAVPLLR